MPGKPTDFSYEIFVSFTVGNCRGQHESHGGVRKMPPHIHVEVMKLVEGWHQREAAEIVIEAGLRKVGVSLAKCQARITQVQGSFS